MVISNEIKKLHQPNPNSRGSLWIGKFIPKHIGYLLTSIRTISDVPPDTVRRPGAMFLDVLQSYIVVESKSST